MKILGYEYEDYLEMRTQIRLALCNVEEYIYIVKPDVLYLISKNDVSMLEIEKYEYTGKMLGIDVYVETIPFSETDIKQYIREKINESNRFKER